MEVLTSTGWKPLSLLKSEDKIKTYDPNTKVSLFVNPENLYSYDVHEKYILALRGRQEDGDKIYWGLCPDIDMRCSIYGKLYKEGEFVSHKISTLYSATGYGTNIYCLSIDGNNIGMADNNIKLFSDNCYLVNGEKYFYRRMYTGKLYSFAVPSHLVYIRLHQRYMLTNDAYIAE